MKSKLLFVALFLSTSAFAQNIAVTLSVDWIVGKDIFEPDSSVLYPELVISYTNLSDQHYYFKKVSDKKLDYPITHRWTMLNYLNSQKPDRRTMAMCHGNYSEEKMIVCVNDWQQSWNNGWEVFLESTYQSAIIEGEEYSTDIINDELTDIHDYLFAQQKDKSLKQLFPDANNAQRMMDSTSTVIRENEYLFVFLSPYEVVRDTFNLAAFAELGGEYQFKLLSDSLSPYLPVYNQGTYKGISMPETLDGYKLFFGKVLSNCVYIKLNARKKNE